MIDKDILDLLQQHTNDNLTIEIFFDVNGSILNIYKITSELSKLNIIHENSNFYTLNRTNLIKYIRRNKLKQIGYENNSE